METNQTVLNNSPNGIIIIGEKGGISYLNPFAEAFFKRTNPETAGKSFTEFLQDIHIDELNILEKCTPEKPYNPCVKATIGDGKPCFLDLWITIDPNASEESRYLVFVNDITSVKKREEDLEQAYAIETTLKKVLHICRTYKKLEDTLRYVLQLTVALPNIKAIPRAVVMSTENNLSRLELAAHIGFEPKEISSFFKKEADNQYSLENTKENIELLCKFIAQKNSSYHAIIEGGSQTVIMAVALEENIDNAFAYENLNSVADVIADTIELKKLKKDQAELIKNLNESLKDLGVERSFSESIFESLNSGLLVLDNGNRVTKTNRAADNLFAQIKDESIIGKTLNEIFGPKTGSLLQGTDNSNYPVKVTDLQGNDIHLDFSFSPITTNEGVKKGKVVAFSDVTELRKIGIKFDKLNRYGAIAEIAAAIAQEIKNPLAGIKSMSQILDGRLAAEDENKEFITRIIKQVDRLDQLLNEFFLYARPAILNKQKVIINDVLRDAWQSASLKCNKKGLSLHENLTTDSFTLLADLDQLKVVFINLFLNAIEAVEDNSYINVSTEFVQKPSDKYDMSLFKGLGDDGSYLVVKIEDLGCGIATDMEDKLFEPFVTSKNNHSGLGLSLVWRILKEHESNIYFESREGKGSTFTLFLKAGRDAN